MRSVEERARAAGPVACSLRLARRGDLALLREMLFEAAYWREDAPRPALAEGLARPDLAKLLAAWGRAGDTALVAEAQSGLGIGAAWFRLWSREDHSYGFVAPEIPELGLAVRSGWRGHGIGARLLQALLAEAARAGIRQLSLSVELGNPALRLYERSGFRSVGGVGGALTMVADVRR